MGIIYLKRQTSAPSHNTSHSTAMGITRGWRMPGPKHPVHSTRTTELNCIRTRKRSSTQPAEGSRTNGRPRKPPHWARPRDDQDPAQVDIICAAAATICQAVLVVSRCAIGNATDGPDRKCPPTEQRGGSLQDGGARLQDRICKWGCGITDRM